MEIKKLKKGVKVTFYSIKHKKKIKAIVVKNNDRTVILEVKDDKVKGQAKNIKKTYKSIEEV